MVESLYDPIPDDIEKRRRHAMLPFEVFENLLNRKWILCKIMGSLLPPTLPPISGNPTSPHLQIVMVGTIDNHLVILVHSAYMLLQRWLFNILIIINAVEYYWKCIFPLHNYKVATNLLAASYIFVN